MIECIKGMINIVGDSLSLFPLNGNQYTTQKLIYQKEIMSNFNGTKEIYEENFPVELKLIE